MANPPKALFSLRKCNVGYVWSPLQLGFLQPSELPAGWEDGEKKQTVSEVMLHSVTFMEMSRTFYPVFSVEHEIKMIC